jgi:NhaP-type Na+/H+ or K+/H+ antiporter
MTTFSAMLSLGGFPGERFQAFARLDAWVIATSDGGAAETGGKVVPIIVAIIMGAFCGLLLGFIVARLARFIAYLAGKHFEGNFLIFVGMIGGAALFAYWAATRGGF